MTPFNWHADAVSKLTPFVISTASSGNLEVCAAVASQRIRLYRLLLVVAGTTNLTWRSASTDLSGAMPMVANMGMVLDFTGDPWYETAYGEALNLNNSAAVGIRGTAWYIQK